MTGKGWRIAPRHPDNQSGRFLDPAFCSTKVYKTLDEAQQAAIDLTYVFRVPVDVIAVYNGRRWGLVVYSAVGPA